MEMSAAVDDSRVSKFFAALEGASILARLMVEVMVSIVDDEDAMNMKEEYDKHVSVGDGPTWLNVIVTETHSSQTETLIRPWMYLNEQHPMLNESYPTIILNMGGASTATRFLILTDSRIHVSIKMMLVG